MASDLRNASFHLSDLRDSRIAEASLENLLHTLAGKIQTSARLAVFAYEAGNEGHSALAATFRELAETERRSFDALLASLHRYLDEMPAASVDAPKAAGR